MYRSVYRKLQFLFKYSCEFPEHAGAAYNVDRRNLVALQEFFCDDRHFFYGGFDHRKDLGFFFRCGLENLGFHVRNLIVAGYSHGHMAAACSLVICVDHFSVFQDADACCAAAHVHNGAVCDF